MLLCRNYENSVTILPNQNLLLHFMLKKLKNSAKKKIYMLEIVFSSLLF